MRLFYTALVLGWLAFCAFQNPACAGVPIAYLGIEQGLSNNAVTSIYQDHNGFLWFGTYDGLNRYDGYNFKVYRNVIGDKTSLCDNHVGVIEGDAAHNLWIGCENGLSVYNPAKANFFTPFFKPWNETTPQLFRHRAHALKEITSERMLVGTEGEGLLVLKKAAPLVCKFRCCSKRVAKERTA